MAGTLTVTEQKFLHPQRPIRKYTLAWVSTAGGAVSGNETGYISGEILRVVFKPDGGGTQPTDLYDVTLLDDAGFDVLAGQGANLSNANTTNVCPGVPMKDGTTTSVRPQIVDDTLELQVSNAGSAKGGTIYLYVR